MKTHINKGHGEALKGDEDALQCDWVRLKVAERHSGATERR